MKFKLIFVLALLALQVQAFDDPRMNCEETVVRIREVPFPRGTELNVNWGEVSGTWVTGKLVFEIGALKVQNNKGFMKIEVFDETGVLVKEGGVVVKNDGRSAAGIVRAVNKTSDRVPDDTFIILRSFKETDRAGRQTGRDLFVVTIRILKEKVKVCQETHHELTKVITHEKRFEIGYNTR